MRFARVFTGASAHFGGHSGKFQIRVTTLIQNRPELYEGSDPNPKIDQNLIRVATLIENRPEFD